MDILQCIYVKAAANPQRVAFPEADDEKMMLAAYEAAKKGYILPILAGDETTLRVMAKNRGINADMFEYANTADEKLKSVLVERYAELPGILLKGKSLIRRMADPLYFALVLEAVGDVQVTFAGISHTTGEVILAAQTIIGLAENITTASSIGIANIPGYTRPEGTLLAFGDSAVCQNPDASQLASIAISACDTVSSLLNWEARCALLSYSTCGSGEGLLVDKVADAVKIANSLRPDLYIDGEFQLDAAIDPNVAAKKVARNSNVAGRANIIIWPDLNTGNVGVKLLQQFAGADAYGPMLQGFRKVVGDCSRGAPVSEIIGNLVMSAVRAQAL